MAFCAKCGTQLDSGKFCPSCGAPVEAPAPAAPAYEAPPVPPVAPTGSFQQSAQEKFDQFTNTADTTAEYDKQDIEANKVMAVLSYFGILVLIPIFGAKESKFARFHANQGLVLFIVEVLYGIVSSILYSLSFALGSIFSLVSLALLIFAILGIVNAAKGVAKELPIIGSFKILK